MKKYLLRFLPMYLTTILVFAIVAICGSRAVSTIAENWPVDRNITFIVDAGHGGEDGGATSCTGVLESGINLQIALRLDDLLHLLGYDTIMIRKTDISIYTEGKTIAAKKISDLKKRVEIVNQQDNAVLISIHQNFFADSRYSGAQVFYNDVSGAKELAQNLQSSFVSSINKGSNRQCKKADSVYLMEHIDRPGLLVECGFLSNPDEESKLRTESYQQKICCVIACTMASSKLNT